MPQGTKTLETSTFIQVKKDMVVHLQDIASIFKQLNYTNLYLQHLGSHVDALEAYIIKLPQI